MNIVIDTLYSYQVSKKLCSYATKLQTRAANVMIFELCYILQKAASLLIFFTLSGKCITSVLPATGDHAVVSVLLLAFSLHCFAWCLTDAFWLKLWHANH